MAYPTLVVLLFLSISPASLDGSHLLLRLTSPALPGNCVSRFTYSAYRVDPHLDYAIPITNGEQEADTCVAPRVSIQADGFRIDFRTVTRDSVRREGVLSYQVRGNIAHRVDPIALRPEDFVDEWLSRPWSEMREWSAPVNAEAHEELQTKTARPIGLAIFRCHEADTWQVEIDLDATDTRYFILQESAEHAYRMLDVRTTPQPSCQRQ
jgi:hypothetical protein